MHSVSLQKAPAHPDGTVVRGDIRSYIKNYGLFVRRFKWIAENKGSILPENDLKMYISKLVDPLAFEAGEVETVKGIERQLDAIFDRDTNWDGDAFTIKTIIRQAGSRGWFVFRGTDSKIVTFSGTGSRAGRVDGRSVTFPLSEDSYLESKIMLQELHEDFNMIYSNPKDGDVLAVRFDPVEDGDFKVQFDFSRDS